MRIRKITFAFAVSILLSTFSSSAFAATATLTGKFRTPSGAQLNGYAKFSMPFAGAVDTACDGGGSCQISPVLVQVAIINGAFTTLTTPRLVRNSDITPAGTYYHAALYTSSGALIQAFNFVIGAVSSFDVGAALQTAITTNNVSYLTPADLNGNNTWTGTNTFNGPVIFNSTITGLTLPCSAAAAANTVCGNNTGAPTTPVFAKVTFPMTDGTTIAPLVSPGFTGTPTAPTPAAGDSSTKLATTAFVSGTLAAGQVLVATEITSCALGLNTAITNGEWNCSGTFAWGTTLPISSYKVSCTLSQPQPPGSYFAGGGGGGSANIYWSSKTTTGFTYWINDDHSGSNGATYFVDCIATR